MADHSPTVRVVPHSLEPPIFDGSTGPIRVRTSAGEIYFYRKPVPVVPGSSVPEGRCQMSALPKREWSMIPSGDWSLRTTKLEGTAYDWSHCLVAPVQIAAN